MWFDILIVVKNDHLRLVQTLNSIAELAYEGNVIIQDSSRTANDPSYIQPKLKIKYCHECDSGLYDGMNRGVSRIEANYFITINCGDILVDLPPYRMDFEKTDIICFAVNITREDGTRDKFTPNVKMLKSHMSICHQGMMINKEFFYQSGGYDTYYEVAADYDFARRCFAKSDRIIECGEVIANFQGFGGVSAHRRLRLEIEYFIIKCQYESQLATRIKIFMTHIGRYFRFSMGLSS
jgi:hypothetical protein